MKALTGAASGRLLRKLVSLRVWWFKFILTLVECASVWKATASVCVLSVRSCSNLLRHTWKGLEQVVVGYLLPWGRVGINPLNKGV